MTKIDIISGFLGAGKTTFIKKMIDEAFTGEKIVLIENEFGEDEECETLQLPNQEAVPVKRKPGRPKKSALDYTASKRDTTKKRGRKPSSTKK